MESIELRPNLEFVRVTDGDREGTVVGKPSLADPEYYTLVHWDDAEPGINGVLESWSGLDVLEVK